MLDKLKELFVKLAEVDAPAGFEEPMMSVLKRELEPHVDNVTVDRRGNVVGVKKGIEDNTPSIALVAHMDQIGFIVSYVEARGFLRFRKLGKPVDGAIQGQHVRVLTKRGSVIGVVGLKPGHITTPEEARRIPPLEDMYIDVGVNSKEEAEALGVRVGAPIVYDAPSVTLARPGLMASRSVDNRAGCAALIKIAEKLGNVPHGCSVFFVGSVEEEMGWKGAQTATFDIDPDMAVAIDTTPAGWQPDVNMKNLVYEVGKGPVIKISELGGAITHPKVRRLLITTAEREGIPFQIGAELAGISDAIVIQQSRSGIPTGALCLPRRYSHSPVEVFDLNDLRNLIKLQVAAIKSIEAGFDLNRI